MQEYKATYATVLGEMIEKQEFWHELSPFRRDPLGRNELKIEPANLKVDVKINTALLKTSTLSKACDLTRSP
jgi:hypothetical protein